MYNFVVINLSNIIEIRPFNSVVFARKKGIWIILKYIKSKKRH